MQHRFRRLIGAAILALAPSLGLAQTALQQPNFVGSTVVSKDTMPGAFTKLYENDLLLQSLIASRFSTLGSAALLNIGTTTGTVADGGALNAETARALSVEQSISSAASAAATAVATETSRAQNVEAAKAPLFSPTFTGTATAPVIAITGPGSTGDVSGMSVTPNAAAAAGTLANIAGNLSGITAPGPTGYAALNALYFTVSSRSLFNSPASGSPTNWLGNGASGSASQYAYGGLGQVVALSGIGDVGLVGATRTTDYDAGNTTGAGRLSIGTMGWAFNFNTTNPRTAWGLYGECRRKNGSGQCHGLEIDATELGNGADGVVPTAKGSGANAAYVAASSGLNIASGGNVKPGGQTGWDGTQNVTQAADAGVAVAVYNNGAKFLKGLIFGENALTGCDGTGGANTCTAVEMGRGAGQAWIDGTTRQAARISSDISPAGPVTKLTFTDAGLYLDQAFSNAGAFNLANGFFGVGTVTPSGSLSSFATMSVPSSTGQYIDNVLTLQNKSGIASGSNTQRGNAAINIRDHLGQERAAFGFSHISQSGASVGFFPNLAYIEGGNLTTDTENTNIGWVFTYPANSSRFGSGAPSHQYQVLRADAGTGNVQISRYDGLYAHEFDATNRLATFYGGDASGLNGNNLRFAPGNGSTPAAINAFRSDNAATDLVVGGSAGGMVQVQGGIRFTTAYTVATLPTCNTGNKGLMLRVDDFNGSPTYNGSLTGGGTTSILAYCTSSGGTYYWSAH